ncbi:hypothetical protein [Calidifontibacillus erzurumensis]|uniref:hypothetical protein n=1 Tax=Calidifontibacillus erzurumensis TaxID=2741433 RepID=UPI0035B539A6
MKRKIKRWLNNEKGFLVFESGLLMKGGVILAIIVGVYVLAIVANEYTRAEQEFVGSEVEADAALAKFYP